MRQLVSVVTDTSVSYFVSDDDDNVTQVAQLLNPGFGVAEVVEVGSGLVELLRLNGAKGRKLTHSLPGSAARVAPTPDVEHARAAAASNNGNQRVVKRSGSIGRPPKSGKAPRVWGYSADKVTAYVNAHPGTPYKPMAKAISGSDEAASVQALMAAVKLAEVRNGARFVRQYDGQTAHLFPPQQSASQLALSDDVEHVEPTS